MAKNRGSGNYRVSLGSLLDVESPWFPRSGYGRAILALVYLGFVTGTYTVAAIFIQGPALLDATDYIPWGILISTYIFFVLTSSGLCFVSSLGHVFGIKEYEVMGKRAVLLAIITLLTGFVVLTPDLGHPERMLYYLLTPNFSSMIWWMGFFYGLEFTFIVAEFLALYNGRMDWARITGIGGLLSATGAVSTLGGVFGVVIARPFYFGAFTPFYFMLTAFLSGLALISLANIIAAWTAKKELDPAAENANEGLRRLLILVLGITLIFTAWKMLVGLYVPADMYRETFGRMVGNWLWQTEVVIGLVVPFVLVLIAGYFKEKAVPITLAASSLILLGLFIGRLDMVIAGQTIPLKALREVELSVYVPSLAEILAVLGAIAFFGLLYYLGERLLELETPAAHQESPSTE